MHYPLLADLLIKPIIEILAKIPIINVIVAIIVFYFLFVLGFQYLGITLRTRRVHEVHVQQYSIFTPLGDSSSIAKNG